MCDSSLLLCVSAEPGESVTLWHVIGGVSFQKEQFWICCKAYWEAREICQRECVHVCAHTCVRMHMHVCLTGLRWQVRKINHSNRDIEEQTKLRKIVLSAVLWTNWWWKAPGVRLWKALRWVDCSSNTRKDAGRGCACQGKRRGQRLEMIQGKMWQNLAMV